MGLYNNCVAAPSDERDMTRRTAPEAGQPLRERLREAERQDSTARVGAAGAPNGPDELHEKHLRQGSKPSTDSILFSDDRR